MYGERGVSLGGGKTAKTCVNVLKSFHHFLYVFENFKSRKNFWNEG